jgi:hypothetical protein
MKFTIFDESVVRDRQTPLDIDIVIGIVDVVVVVLILLLFICVVFMVVVANGAEAVDGIDDVDDVDACLLSCCNSSIRCLVISIHSKMYEMFL